MNTHSPTEPNANVPKGKAPQWPLTSKWVLLLVLTGALLLLYWIAAPQAEKNVTIPINPRGLPNGLVLSGPSLKGVDLVVKGPQSILDRLGELKLEYMLDLSQASLGRQQIAVQRHHITLPTGLSLKTLLTPHLTVTVDHAAEKKVPVVIALSGKTAAGFTVNQAQSNPAMVTIRGPQAKVSAVEKLMTKPIRLDGQKESFKKEIALDATEGLEVVSPVAVVTAHIQVTEKIVTQEFNDLPVIARGTPHQVRITPPTITVTVKGPLNTLAKLLDDGGLNVYVDLKDLAPGVYVRRASIALPVKTTLVGVAPELFTVRLTQP